jgi:hypothetical protein
MKGTGAQDISSTGDASGAKNVQKKSARGNTVN